ncbi:MAG: BolA family transcriptional regulator [Cohaesibacter sp.]|nr:BolA family transcriptional regulator [Cohaesibacter sp.]MCV6601925.1 BolA family transcriptional regulator [Cohaesibacter sp.]
MTVKHTIEKKLTHQLQPDFLQVIDESEKHRGHGGWREGGETHFAIKIQAKAFADLSRIQAHRLVHEALADELAGPIHALQLEIIKS